MNSPESIDALFLFATEGILVTDQEGIIIQINPSAEKLFGYEKGELLNQKIEILIPERFTQTHHKHRDNFNKSPHARPMGAGMQLYGRKKDGKDIAVEISLSPYTSENKKYVIAFIVDVTIRKQAEEKLKNYSHELEQQVKNRTLILEEAIDELEKTKKNLNNALIKEKELNELKSRFVSMVSHEFRTPLTTIMSSLSLITKYAEQNDIENQQKHISKIKNSINNLIDILNDLLSISKLEEGKIDNNPEQFHLKSFVDELIHEIKPILKLGQQIIHSHKGDERAYLDKKLLKNILLNLLSNAIKFSPEKSSIEILTEIKTSELLIQVKDKGIGISESDQKKLFERFFRGHNATHIQGTGLGLNIVAKYVEILQGSITFESAENRGTIFSITLPQ